MRFRVRNVRKGYCEVWANERSGERYSQIATVRCVSNGSWLWQATDYYLLPERNSVTQTTKRECIRDCERTALLRLVALAIKSQRRESVHFHSRRRDAGIAVDGSRLFTMGERVEIWKRLESFDA